MVEAWAGDRSGLQLCLTRTRKFMCCRDCMALAVTLGLSHHEIELNADIQLIS